MIPLSTIAAAKRLMALPVEPFSLREAALLLGVMSSDLDRALWLTIGKTADELSSGPKYEADFD